MAFQDDSNLHTNKQGKRRGDSVNDKGGNKLNKKKDDVIKIEIESTISKHEKNRIIFTTESCSRKPSDDDDDFVNMPPVIVPVQNILNKQTQEKRKNSLQSLSTRFPPEHITNTMALLNNEQRICV